MTNLKLKSKSQGNYIYEYNGQIIRITDSRSQFTWSIIINGKDIEHKYLRFKKDAIDYAIHIIDNTIKY